MQQKAQNNLTNVNPYLWVKSGTLQRFQMLWCTQVDTQNADENFEALSKYAINLTAKASKLDPVSQTLSHDSGHAYPTLLMCFLASPLPLTTLHSRNDKCTLLYIKVILGCGSVNCR